ncbi:MAG: carboxylesterase family protein [Bifidobacteriaceae bacterium]|jgi:para-nitrobenzyl esterase|nr:carboxylesterase family protein [Bifidobacteriaceae bacterium]
MIEHVHAATIEGPIRGLVDRGVATFRGIPYGAPVSGPNRWKPPQPPDRWSRPFDATKTGPRAVQRHGNLFSTFIGDYFSGGRIGALGLNDQVDSEDCLVLNVLTPAVDDNRRPVMVYLHGGGYTEGSGVIATSAQRLVAEQDVVLVSVNHRLNVFGYLYLGAFDSAYADSGNVGTLDLILALRWVSENIATFGGDPSNVTIFGESGGGGKVCVLLTTPLAHGLFHKAIIESGPWLSLTSPDRAAESARGVLARVGADPTDIPALGRLCAHRFREAILPSWTALGPVKDGRTLSDEPFSDRALDTSRGVPLLLGHCEDEMNWLVDLDRLDDTVAAAALNDMFEPDELASIREVYEAELERPGEREILLKALGDAYIGQNTTRIAERKVDAGDPVFRYLFRYRPPIEDGRYGAFHTAELPLVFRHVRYAEAEALSRLLAAAWAGFARTGDPAQPGFDWTAYNRETRTAAVFDLRSSVVSDPSRERRQLWDRLPLRDLGLTTPGSSYLRERRWSRSFGLRPQAVIFALGAWFFNERVITPSAFASRILALGL